MKERPILFSGPMVRAILDGRKTQTRRIVKPAPSTDTTEILHSEGCEWREWFPLDGNMHPKSWQIRCPYGQKGDQLWVKENFHLGEYVKGPNAQGAAIAYAEGKTTCFRHMTDAEMERCRLKPDPRPWAESRTIPSIHMPRWAGRVTLEITAIRVERLQDISEVDAKAEGIDIPADSYEGKGWMAFKALWLSINGRESWDANPFVWVVEFQRI